MSEKKTKLEDIVTAQGLQIHEMVEKVREKKAQQQEEVTSDPSSATVAEGGLRLRWMVEESATEIKRGQAAVDGCMVYFLSISERIIHSYDSERKVWSTLPKCPHWECSLAVVNGLLTTIGGEIFRQSKYTYTNTLLSLIVRDKEDKEWYEHFHPMPTKRAGTAAVCTQKALVVAGGADGGIKPRLMSTVEVMDTETLQWSTASSLPHPLYRGSATVCGDCLYLMESQYVGLGVSTDAVLTCYLSNLLHSCQPQSLIARIKSAFTKREAVWQETANVPVTDTTCVAFNGHLLAVGGLNSNGQSTKNIYALNLTSNSWEVTSHMPTARSRCLVAVLPGNKLIVAGGERQDGLADTRIAGIRLAGAGTDIVQIAEMI